MSGTLENRERELDVLLEVAQAVSSARSLKQVLRLIALRTAQACQVDRCSILLFDDERRKLVPLMSQFASGDEARELWQAFREKTYVESVDEVPAIREVIRQRKPFVLDDRTGSDALPRAWTEPFGIRALLGVPLISRDQVIGLMALDYTTEGRRFATWQVHLALTIGSQLAVFIENARLFEKIQQSEARYRHLVENVHDLIFELDTNGIITYCSPSVEYLGGLTQAEVIGHSFTEFIHPDDLPVLMESFARTLEGAVEPAEFRVRAKDGREGWARSLSRPVLKAGEVVGLTGVITDITERKRAEEEIRWRARMLAALHETALDLASQRALPDLLQAIVARAVGLLRAKGASVYFYRPDTDDLELVLDYHAERDATGAVLKRGEGLSGKVLETGRPLAVADYSRWEGRSPQFEEDGFAAVAGVPVLWGGRLLGVLNVLDEAPRVFSDADVALLERFSPLAAAALEQARLLEEVRRQRDFAESILTTANSLILGLDLGGRVILFNDHCIRTTGWRREEALGQDWFTNFLPERFRPPVGQVWRELLEKGLPNQYTNPILTRDGEERVIAWSNTVLRDGEGRPLSVIAIGQDITEQRQLEEQLRQAQKMEAIGTLAGGIAHDFNNLLGSILGFASLIERELPGDASLRSDVATIISSARRGAELTNQLLAFARGGRYQVGPVNLNAVAGEVIRLLSRTVDKTIQIEPRLAADLAAVEGDSGQLHQMLLNLCLNARDAMPAGGQLVIETRNETLDAAAARGEAGLTPGQYVYLRMTDTGVGMDPVTQERIFEPFFTTKKGRRGEKHSGLGLAMVYGIVRGHKGAIHVYSELGQGSTFDVYLPALPLPAQTAVPAEVKVRGGTETVVVVDDEPDICALLCRVLKREGYTVLPAESGAEALAIYREHQEEIHLVVLDLIMPEMSGAETFDRLRELAPDVRVLLSSGYSEEGQARELLSAGALGFLQKPYDFQTVLRKVREVLDAV